MRGKLSPCCILFFLAFIVSCKKETFPGLNGQWMSVAVYTLQDNGAYGWSRLDGFRHFYVFGPGNSFISYTDVPGGSGMYRYDQPSGNLELYYDGTDGSAIRTEVYHLEKMADGRMVLSRQSLTDSVIFKTEYSKMD